MIGQLSDNLCIENISQILSFKDDFQRDSLYCDNPQDFKLFYLGGKL